MKQHIDLIELDVPASVLEYVRIWKEKKGYTNPHVLLLGECIELNIASAYTLHFENSDGRFFNKLISNGESVIGWEGDELIDILWFDTQQAIKQRLSSGTFNHESS